MKETVKKVFGKASEILTALVLLPFWAAIMVFYGAALLLQLFWDSFVIDFLQNSQLKPHRPSGTRLSRPFRPLEK